MKTPASIEMRKGHYPEVLKTQNTSNRLLIFTFSRTAKKYCLTLLFLHLLVVLPGEFCRSFAQGLEPAAEPTTRNHILKTNLLSPLMGSGSLFFEAKVAPKASFQVGVFAGKYKPISFTETTNKLWGVVPEVRFYLDRQRNGLAGFYLAPYLKYQHVNQRVEEGEFNFIDIIFIDIEGYTKNFHEVGGGLSAGYQLVRRGGFTFDMFGGFGYLNTKRRGRGGLGGRINASIGYAF